MAPIAKIRAGFRTGCLLLAFTLGCLTACEAAEQPAEEVLPIGFPPEGRSLGVAESLAFSPDGKTLVCASHNNVVYDSLSKDYNFILVWDVAANREIARLSRPRCGVHRVAFTPDGKMLVGAAGYLQLWRMPHGTLSGSIDIAAGKDSARRLAVSPDGTLLAIGDTRVNLWDLKLGRMLWASEGGDEELDMKFAPDSQALVTVGRDSGGVCRWQVKRTPAADGLLERVSLVNTSLNYIDSPMGKAGFNKWVASIDYSPDSKLVAVACLDGTVRLLDTNRSDEVGRIEAETGAYVFAAVAFSPDGKLLATSDDRNKYTPRLVPKPGEKFDVCIWDVKTRKQVARFKDGHRAQIWALAYSPDGSLLASAGADERIVIWDVKTGKEKAVIDRTKGVSPNPPAPKQQWDPYPTSPAAPPKMPESPRADQPPQVKVPPGGEKGVTTIIGELGKPE